MGLANRQYESAGSSPRVRGKPYPAEGRYYRRGLIPACAGKTSTPLFTCCGTAAHPRVCGENLIPALRRLAALGSSPRVRGKQSLRRGRPRSCRLIPACAGKTPCPRRRRRPSAAHPRVCGENDGACGLDRQPDGSSPRVRGKPHAPGDRALPGGLIPACAGKTCSAAAASSSWQAHPRVCGENRSTPRLVYARIGSSPRVRGKRAPPLPQIPDDRLIPACAGKTSKPSAASRRSWAHPRVCGENACDPPSRGRGGGSSPRVRGKPH